MSNTTFIRPSKCSSLDTYIDSFVCRNIKPENTDLPIRKIIPPNYRASLDFFFGYPFKTIDLSNGNEVPYKTTAIRGCRTAAKYAISFHRPFSSISVKFTPTGLYSILGLEMDKLTNADVSCKFLKLPFDIENLYNRIRQASRPEAQVELIENTFQNVLATNPIKSRLSDFLMKTELSEKQEIFLSERQQQRLFKQEIGLAPKAFYNLRRFSNLLKAKKQNAAISWTSLAHEFGYFDQAHFIKVFYSSLGISPSLFNMESLAL